MIKQIRIFRHETIKDIEPFLTEHTDAQLLFAEHFSLERKDVYILSIGDKKDLCAVTRPNETPYQIPVIYAIYEADGNPPEGAAIKTKTFSITDSVDAINKFLSSCNVLNILVVPTAELTGPLDNYVAGEYGPVPKREPARVRSHKLIVVYKE